MSRCQPPSNIVRKAWEVAIVSTPCTHGKILCGCHGGCSQSFVGRRQPGARGHVRTFNTCGDKDPRRSSNGSSRRGHLGRCRCRAGPPSQPLLDVVADPFLNPLAGGHMLSPCPQGVHHRWRMRRKTRSRVRSNLRLGAWARWRHQHARYLDDVGVRSFQSKLKVGPIFTFQSNVNPCSNARGASP